MLILFTSFSSASLLNFTDALADNNPRTEEPVATAPIQLGAILIAGLSDNSQKYESEADVALNGKFAAQLGDNSKAPAESSADVALNGKLAAQLGDSKKNSIEDLSAMLDDSLFSSLAEGLVDDVEVMLVNHKGNKTRIHVKKQVLPGKKGKYNITIEPSAGKKLKFSDVTPEDIQEVKFEEFKREGKYSNSVAIDLSGLNFTNATYTAVARRTGLYKCKEWNYTEQNCYGEWVKIQVLTPGQQYSVDLYPEDPALSEGDGFFFDGFEGGLENWTINGTGAVWELSTVNPYNGSQHVRVIKPGNGNPTTIRINVSTSGFPGIMVSYARQLIGIDGADEFTASWFNGTHWKVLETTGSSSADDAAYVVQNFTLTKDAENNPLFALAFTCEANAGSEECRIDDINVWDDPPTNISACTTITQNAVLVNDLTSNLSADTSQCISINGDNVYLDCQGFSITGNGSGRAIEVINNFNVTIRNCVLQNFNDNIFFSDVNDSVIFNNTILNAADDNLDLQDTNYSVIDLNNVTGSFDNNIVFIRGVGNNITRNIIENAAGDAQAQGLALFTDSRENRVANNTILNNQDEGIRATGPDNLLINNTIIGSGDDNIEITAQNTIVLNRLFNSTDDGIAVTTVDLVNISDNLVVGSGNDGIFLQDSNFTVISNNNVSDSFDNNIVMLRSFFTNITNNILEAASGATTSQGLAIFNSSDYSWVANNTILNNQDEGIRVTSSNNTIIDNTLQSNGDDGIEVVDSADNTLRYNTITLSNDDGIVLSTANLTLVENNTLVNNSNDGIFVTSGSNRNTIRANVIRDNIANFSDGISILSNLDDQEDNLVEDNIIINMGDDGIQFINRTFRAVARNNTIIRTGLVTVLGDGILFVGVMTGNITGNNLTDLGNRGMRVSRSANITVEHNRITNVSDRFINIFLTNDTQLINNTLFEDGPTEFILEDTENSVIDDTEIGNYSFTNASVEIKKTGKGNLKFKSKATGKGRNLSQVIVIEKDVIFVNATAAPEFNQSANLTYFDFNATTAELIVGADFDDDGSYVECPASICTVVENDQSIEQIILNVTQFSKYHLDRARIRVQDNSQLPALLFLNGTPELRTNTTAAITRVMDATAANLTLPNGTVAELVLLNQSKDIYNRTLTLENFVLRGQHNISFLGNDTTGLTNATVTVTFNRVPFDIIDVVNDTNEQHELSTVVDSNTSGLLNLTISINRSQINTLRVIRHSDTSPRSRIAITNATPTAKFVARYVVDTNDFNFTEVIATSTADGTSVFECDWNTSSQSCIDTPVKIKKVSRNQDYNLSITKRNRTAFVETNNTVDIITRDFKLLEFNETRIANPDGTANVTQNIGGQPIELIEIKNVNESVANDVRIDEVPVLDAEFEEYVQQYAIDTGTLNFTTANITITAKGNKLRKCSQWNITTRTCEGFWETIRSDLVPGQNYTIEITPGDPGFQEINASDAWHLDSTEDRNIIANIYDAIAQNDGNFSPPIRRGEYARTLFVTNLSDGNVIDFVARANKSNDILIEIYPFNSTELLVTTGFLLNSSEHYFIELNLPENETHDTFDFKTVSATNDPTAAIEYDFIHDQGPPTRGTIFEVIKGENTISGTGGTVATGGDVNADVSMLIFSTRHGSDAPNGGQITGQLLNSTHLDFQRSTSAAGTQDVFWYVAEFDSGVRVYRGRDDVGGGTELTHAIGAVLENLSQAFIVPGGYRQVGSTWGNDDHVRFRIVNTTHIGLEGVGATTAGTDVSDWQVVVFNGSFVQRDIITMPSGIATMDINLTTAVTTNRSFAMISYDSSANTLNNGNIRATLVSSTQLQLNRTGTGSAHSVAWEVVELPIPGAGGGNIVQHDVESISSGTATANIAINPVVENHTVSFSASGPHGGLSIGEFDNAVTDIPGRGMATHNLTNTTNLLLTRAATDANAIFSWFVVEFEPPFVSQNASAVTVTKTDNPDPVNTSANLTYQINVSSTGGETAFNVTVNDTYPAQTIFLAASPTPLSGTNNTFILGNMTPGTTIAVNITVLTTDVINNTQINNSVLVTFNNITGGLLSEQVTESTIVVTEASVLNATLITPVPNILTNVTQNDTFTLSANITCVGGATCGNVSVYARRNSTLGLERTLTGTASTTPGLTTTVPIGATIADGNSVLFFSMPLNISEPGSGQIAGTILNSTHLQFYRTNDTPERNFTWHIAEFKDGIRVQRGMDLPSSGETTVTLGSPIDTGSSFIIPAGYNNTGTIWGDDDFVRARIIDSNQIGLLTTGPATENDVASWQVVEIPGSTVQRGLTTMTATSTMIFVNLSTQVDTSRSFVIATHTMSGTINGSGGNILTRLVNSTQIEFVRHGGDMVAEVSWEVVQLPLRNFVQHGVTSFDVLDEEIDVAISQVNTSRAVAFASTGPNVGLSSGNSSQFGDDNPGHAMFNMNLTNSTNLRLTRLPVNSVASLGWFVAEFNDSFSEQFIAISTTAGDTPLYTTSPQPQFCVLEADETCQLNWTVNASGLISETIIVNVNATKNASFALSENGTVQIVAPAVVNLAPEAENVTLNATSVNNLTTDNLTLFFDSFDVDGDSVKNITNFFRNDTSITLLHMPFEANGGQENSITKDYSSFGKNGTIFGGMSFNSSGGYDGFGTYELDGVDDFVNLTQSALTNLTANLSEVTLSLWIKPRDFSAGQGIWNECQTTFWQFAVDTDNWYTRDTSTGSNGARNNDMALPSIPVGEWHHLAFVYSVARGVKEIYLDGTLNASNTTSVDQLTGNRSFAAIGDACDGTNFNGTIDEVLLFNRSLSAEQIDLIFRNRTDIISSNETILDEIWRACATPNDNTVDGNETCSNNVTILFVAPNIAPESENVTLNATSAINSTLDNLTLFFDSFDVDGNPVKNVTNFFVNNISFTMLNMPFEANGGSESTVTKDYSGFGNNGTVNGATFSSANGFDGFGTYEFDGTSDTIRMEMPQNMQITGNLTLALWAFRDTNNTVDNFMDLVGDGEEERMNHLYQFWIGSDALLRLEWEYDNGSNEITTATDPVNVQNGSWVFWTVTRDINSNEVRFYENGIQLGGVVNYTNDPTGGNESNFTIGAEGNGADPFDGRLDELRIYNRTLSSEQIFALFTNHTDVVASQETVIGEIWQGCVTPNDRVVDGNETCSNNITINAANLPPVVENVTLTATSTSNLTTDNLTVAFDTYDNDSTLIHNITDWRVNNLSIALLNMPFETQVFNASAGGVRDYSIFNSHGVRGGGVEAQGPTWNLSGQVGGAYVFDGVNDWINTTSTSLQNSSNFTLTLWFRTRTIPVNNDSGTTQFMLWQGISNANGFGNSPTNTQPEMHLGLGRLRNGTPEFLGDQLYFFLGPGEETFTDSGILNVSAPFNDSQNWTFVAVAVSNMSSAPRAQLYVNGILQGTDTGSLELTNRTNWTAPIYIGRPGASARFFNGTMDEVLILNRTLSAEQISIMYNAGNSSRHVQDMHSQETRINDTWETCVTPNDNNLDGTTVCSNNVTILQAVAFNFSDVSVVKTDSSDPADTSLNLTYQINVTTNGTGIAFNTTVNDTYPSQVIFLAAEPTPLSGTNNTFILGNLTVGTTVSINITVLTTNVSNNTVINNSVAVTFNNETGDLITRTATESTTLVLPSVANRAPEVDNVTLTASDPKNLTTHNLTANFDGFDFNNDSFTNITNFFVNNNSLMVLLMPFEGAEGNENSVAKDYSPMRNNATVSGSVFNETGGHDGFGDYFFDEPGDFIQINTTGFGVTNITFMARGYLRTFTPAETYIFGHTTLPAFANRIQLYEFDSQVRIGLGDTHNLAQGSNISTNVWHHFALVLNGSNFTLYVDGTVDIQGGFSGLTTLGGLMDIGNNGNPATRNEAWNGSLDDIRIYNRTLTPEQIFAVFNNDTNMIVHQETVENETWYSCVTPNDRFIDGNETCSNNITIRQRNVLPIVENITLNATSTDNFTTDNLTVFFDSFDNLSEAVVNITNFLVNNVSFTTLYLPFEANGFNEGSVVKDYSEFGRNGTVTRAVYNTTGGINGFGSMEFNGINTSIDGIVNQTINPQAGTIMLWARPNVFAENLQQHLIWAGDPAGNGYGPQQELHLSIRHFNTSHNLTGFVFFYGDNEDGPNVGQLTPSENYTFVGSGNLTDDRWYHVTVTWDLNVGRTRLYLNGSLLSEDNNTGESYNTSLWQDTMFIGRSASSTIRFYNGTMDDLRIYDRALSPEQILVTFLNNTRIVSNETATGEVWQACTTPNDGTQDGTKVCSNNLTIVAAPAPACPRVFTTSQTLTEDITCPDTAVIMNASDIALDCAGFSISYNTDGGASEFGVLADGRSGVTVRNCVIQDVNSTGAGNAGINFTFSNNSVIRENTIFGNSSSGFDGIAGIWLTSDINNVTVLNNTINVDSSSGSIKRGINMDDVRASTFSANTITTNNGFNNDGFFVSSPCEFNIVENNTIATNGTFSNNGISLNSCDNNNISQNAIVVDGTTLNDGIQMVSGSAFNRIDGNFINATGSGIENNAILIETSSEDNLIQNNILQVNGSSQSSGIDTSNSNDLRIFNNTIISDGTGQANRGMVVNRTLRLNFSDNIINTTGLSENTGVRIELSNDTLLFGNTIRTSGGNASHGIEFLNATSNNATDNTVTTTGTGGFNVGAMLNQTSQNNFLFGNTITTGGTTDNVGVRIEGASFSNQFWNNTIRTNGSGNNNDGFRVGGPAFDDFAPILVNNVVITNGSSLNDGFFMQGDIAMVDNNTFIIGSGRGIDLFQADSINITGNTLRLVQGLDGIRLVNNADRNRVENNDITFFDSGSDRDGIELAPPVIGNKVIGNTIRLNGTNTLRGISDSFNAQFDSSHNIYANNTVIVTGSANNVAGILVEGGIANKTNLTISGNVVIVNGTTDVSGIRLIQDTVGNRIFSNNISVRSSQNSFGIQLTVNVSQLNVSDNNITVSGTTSNNTGFSVSNVSGLLFTTNIIRTNGTSRNYGIELIEGADGNTLSNNTIVTGGTSGTNYGILINDTQRVNISDNIINTTGVDENYGIRLEDSENNVFFGDVITTRGQDNSGGVLFTSDSNNNTVQQSTITVAANETNNHGVHMVFGFDNRIIGNTITSNGTSDSKCIEFQAGLSAGPRNVLIENNTMLSGGSGGINHCIRFEGVPGSAIVNNDIRTLGIGAVAGIVLETNSQNNSVYLNNIRTANGDLNDGIAVVEFSHGNNITSNTIHTGGGAVGNNDAIEISSVNFTNVENNIITSAVEGISVQSAVYFTNVTNNTVNLSSIGRFGISVTSDGFENRFISNKIHTISNTSTGIILNTNGTFFDQTLLNNTFFWINFTADTANNITNTTFAMPDGQINVLPQIQINGSQNLNRTSINITSNNAFLDSVELPFFNTSSIIDLNSITFANPIPIVDFNNDGAFTNCPVEICDVLSFTNNLFVFNVTQFTSYRAHEVVSLFDLAPFDNQVVQLNDTVNITANATGGIGIDFVTANVTLPNGTLLVINLENVTRTIFNYSWLNLTQRGQYNITFFTNDTFSIFNLTESTFFIRQSKNLVDIRLRRTELHNDSFVLANYSTTNLSNVSNVLNLSVTLNGSRVSTINITAHFEDSFDSILDIDDWQPRTGSAALFAINPEVLNFTNATVTVNATGQVLRKCENWNVTEQDCDGSFVTVQNIEPGQNYVISLNATDPGFSESSPAVDVALAPVSNETFVLAYIRNDTNTLEFRYLDTDGTLIANSTVDATVDTDSRVSVAPINSTHVAVSWVDGPSDIIRRQIFNLTAGNTTGILDVVTGVGLFTDVSVSQIGDRFGICNANDGNGDAEFRAYNNTNAAEIVSTVQVDSNMRPEATLQNLVECAGVNSTRNVFAWFDDQGANTLVYSVLDQNGNLIVDREIIDNTPGDPAQIATTAIDNNKFAILWYDQQEEDITLTVRHIDNTELLAPTDIDLNAGTESRVALTTLRNDSSLLDFFVAVWFNQSESAIKAAVFNGTGSIITAPFTVDSTPNTAFRLLDVTAKEPMTNNSICPGKFIVAFSNNTDQGIFRGYDIDGTEWDGTCAEGQPDLRLNATSIFFNNTFPRENENISVSATICNIGTAAATDFNVTFKDGNETGGVEISNETITSLAAGSCVVANDTYISVIGNRTICAVADAPLPTGVVTESNESNNVGCTQLHVQQYSFFFGQINSNLTLGDNDNDLHYAWNHSDGGKLYFFDADSAFNFSALQALGRNTTNGTAENDFEEATISLNMTVFNESVTLLWAVDNSTPRRVVNMTVSGRLIEGVPIINSTNTSFFITGILWDTQDDIGGDGQFDIADSEDLVFVVNISQNQAGGLGDSIDYEARIPSLLREYKPSADVISVITELN